MRVLLGVTGCIAAYKSALILRILQKRDCDVVPVMTETARLFLGPLTLEKLAGHKVLPMDGDDEAAEIAHIAEARKSQLLLVAPATANVLGKFAHGIADDFLSTLYLSTTTPVVVAPAMNVEMWKHPATQENLQILKRRGVSVVPPESGYQACGEVGQGRLADPEKIADVVLQILSPPQTLSGRQVLVTAGPTIEDIDPVRYLSNRASGRMGYALAAEAVRRGAEVTLVAGPTHLEAPAGAALVAVRSAAEMAEAVLGRFDACDVVVKAAAVCDFTPASRFEHKVKKTEPLETLELVRTVDILRTLGEQKKGQVLVGFAAESESLVAAASAKLVDKNLDLMVANDITRKDAGFASDHNQATLIHRSGEAEKLPYLSKHELAGVLWDRIEQILASNSSRQDGKTSPKTKRAVKQR